MVLSAADKGKELNQLTLEEMRDFSRQIEQDVYDWLNTTSCLERRNLPGGTGPKQVKTNLEKAKKELIS